MIKSYDVIVVGAGHAGIEASLAGARMGMKTLLLTLNLDSVGQMSCNPSIGGLAKGQVVREVDALGGEMAKVTDKTGLQFRMLNMSKGPAVRSPRAQCDKKLYQLTAKHVVEKQENLDLRQGEAAELVVERSGGGTRAVGIVTKTGMEYQARAVILTTGTFLKGLLHHGMDHSPGGRAGEGRAEVLSEGLRDLGFEVGRMKTGTPMRINSRTIDYSKCLIQPGDEPPIPFSHFTEKITRAQLPCWLTHTHEETGNIIRGNLDRSPLYSGKIRSIGPRYCPSIEDKIVKFPHHGRHQVFLEPEGYDTEEVYVNGLSTSLPEDVQWDIVRSVPGLEDASIMRPGYAVEYDFCPPTQCHPTLETKRVEGLYFAGQICGTTGYEEAAGQGLMAGANAALKIKKEPPFVLKRDEAYIGVMIDDLVTKGVDEPYRLFTSRAEYRLHLRSDNADLRLMDHGRRIGLIDEDSHRRFCEYRRRIENPVGGAPRGTPARADPIHPWSEDKILNQIAVREKYRGYLARQDQIISKFRRSEGREIPRDFDYDSIPGLLNESRQKLNRIRPGTLGQASRIPGIPPSCVGVLSVYLERRSCGRKALFLLAALMLAIAWPLRAEDATGVYSYPKDTDWIKNSVVYEVYLRAFSPEGKFSGLESELFRIKGLGADCLLILPVHPSRVSDAGGAAHPLAVEDSSAVSLEYGTKDGFKNLADQAHGNGIRVLLAWVADGKAPEAMKGKMLAWMKDYPLDGFFLIGGEALPPDFLKELKEAFAAVRPGFVTAVADEDFYGTVLNAVSGAVPVSSLNPILEADAKSVSVWPVPIRFIEHFDRPRSAAILADSSRSAAALLFSLTGVPLLYAGQEIGETRQPSLVAREPIDWKTGLNMHGDVRKFYKKLTALRKDHPSLPRGQKFRVAVDGNDSILIFAATYREDAVLAAFNFSPEPADLVFEVPSIFYSSKGRLMLQEVFGNGKLSPIGAVSTRLRLPAHGCEIWEMK